MADKNDKVNILVVSSKYLPEYAGSGLRACRTYKRLSGKYGFRYKVICGSVAFNETKRYRIENIPVYRIACKPFRHVGRAKSGIKERLLDKASRKLKNGINYLAEAAVTWGFLFRYGPQFGLIHIFGNNHVTAAAFSYAKMTGKPLIVEVCNEIKRFGQYEPSLLKILFGRGMPRNSRLICISKRLKEICLKDGFTGEIWCRPNPVDPSKFYFNRDEKPLYRKRLNLFTDDDIVLLNIGKICPLKNQSFLIDVLSGLPEKYKMVMAGPLVSTGPDFKRDNIYFNELKEKIEDLKMADRVKVKNGFLDNADEFMKAVDIYLMPSRIEACATPILEALTCGIPVVAHRIEGVTTEWIEPGINGYLAPLDLNIFREGITMAAALKRDKLEDSARRMIGQFSSNIIDERYADLITGLLKGMVK